MKLLFKNVLYGMGTVLEIFPRRKTLREMPCLERFRRIRTGHDAMKHDWEAVGLDFYRVIEREKQTYQSER